MLHHRSKSEIRLTEHVAYTLISIANDVDAFQDIVHQLMVKLSVALITEAVVASCQSACTQRC